MNEFTDDFTEEVAETFSEAGSTPKRGRRKEEVEGSGNVLQTKMFRLRKKMDKGLIEEIENMDERALRARIVQSECAIHESEQAKEADDDLKSLKDQVKEAAASYSEVKKAQTLILKYATCLLDSRGQLD